MDNIRKSSWQVLIVILALSIGVWVFNYTNAQKTDESGNVTPSLSNHVDYTGLFDVEDDPQNYLSNGNFYSSKKPRKLIIDTGLVDKVEASIYWYDKVLNEFPRTQEANKALKAKIRTLIGWQEGYGEDKKMYGLHDRLKGGKYFPLLETTFSELEAGFPNDEYLEALAYQIAQRYLIFALVYNQHIRYSKDAVRWLEKTITLANGRDTFYSHLAKIALGKISVGKLTPVK